MTDIMEWSHCSAMFIRKVETDPAKVKAIINAAELRLKYLENAALNRDNISFIVEGYYEAIKELLVALLLSHGLRSKNHQCLISYFYHTYTKYEAEAHLISQMSYLRNRLDYYGEPIELEFYEKNKQEFGSIINLIKKLIKQK
ncbi:hypothetical protein J4470_04340 [Candidatus Woesearchaeota archaeon]|nr:hypothetical protein [Candidatus Woesearchaeota archaeon]